MTEDFGIAKPRIKSRLIKVFTLTILIPSIITAVVGVWKIREEVYAQAEAKVNSDLGSAIEIYHNHLERLRDLLRIHATRRAMYEALNRRDASMLGTEFQRVFAAEGLDFLTIVDTSGRVFYRGRNPSLVNDDQRGDPFIRHVLETKAPISGAEIATGERLSEEMPELAERARMTISPTPQSQPSQLRLQTSGMLLRGAAPIFTAEGRFLGVLTGGYLVNRDYTIVDQIRKVVFKDEVYQGAQKGFATIFQNDVRISTNFKNTDGSRGIATRVSAEVAGQVLQLGKAWRGRAFVVNDWYLAAAEPLRNIQGNVIGMLSVGILEEPYRRILWKNLGIFLGINFVTAILVILLAIRVSNHISQPIRAMADAAVKISEGDYQQKVEITSADEIGILARNFNTMVNRLLMAHQELRRWAETLEGKVAARTAELRAMQAHLIKTEKLAGVGKLAAGVAHEINNPLTCVLTSGSILLEDVGKDHPWREDLQTIVDETLRCRKIVNGLLDFSRQSKPKKEEISLNRVVEDVLALVRNQVSFSNVLAHTQLAPELPLILADNGQIRQVLLNVVLNAAQAMPQGGEIRIVSGFDSAEKMVRLTVSDTGPGIPENIRGQLFEPFFTTKQTGTGLGLAIAYGIIELHKGKLSIDSAPGRGTTVSIEIPSE
jgi:two-component system, NtrC family, sensor kinase